MKFRTMSLLIAIGLVALFLFQPAPQPTAAQETGTADQPRRTVTVSGMGQVEITPDRAVVTLGVDTTAETATEALAQNSQQMQALIDALQEAGVAEENIQTQAIQLFPRYSEPTPPPQPSEGQPATPELIGYQAINLVQVRTTDIEGLGELLDAAVQAGGNRVEGIGFEVQDATEALDQAREEAWNDAQRKAEQLAGLADAELGDVLAIGETSSPPQPFFDQAIDARSVAAVPVQPGTQSVQVSINVTWLLQPAAGQ